MEQSTVSSAETRILVSSFPFNRTGKREPQTASPLPSHLWDAPALHFPCLQPTNLSPQAREDRSPAQVGVLGSRNQPRCLGNGGQRTEVHLLCESSFGKGGAVG